MRRRGFATALLTIAGSALRAQDPVRLPGVTIKGEAGPGLLIGVVRDDQGFTIDGVEFIIPILQRRTHAGADGSYRFENLPQGTFEVWARKIGYRQQIQKIKIGPAGAGVDFELARAPRALPPVVTSAEGGGLSGVVADTAFRLMPGAAVRVMGQGRTATTDSLGEFFFPLKRGDYLVQITKMGYGDRLVSVTIPRDSGKRVLAYLEPVTTRPSKWVALDLSYLMAWTKKGQAGFFTRHDLEKRKIEWVYGAVVLMSSQFRMRGSPDPDCEVIVDGRKLAQLKSPTTEEIDSVEIFNYRDGRDGRGSTCPLIYIWTR